MKESAIWKGTVIDELDEELTDEAEVSPLLHMEK